MTGVLDQEPRPFFSPPRVVVGRGAVERTGALLVDLGVREGTAMLVTDATLARLGLAGRVGSALTSAGFEVRVYSDIEGEPTEESAGAAVEAARGLGPAAVVGVGGGSALDVAKLVAVLLTNEGPLGEYLDGRPFSTPPAPLVLLPTTAGTGAESSRNAVLSRRGFKAFLGSPHLVPAAAVLDPELTLSLPPNITAWTGMDALSHCVEALLSTTSTLLTDAVAVRGIQIVRRHLEVACARGGDLSTRAQMQVAAFLGGQALNAGMVLGHSIAYTLANRLHLPHGLSCALALHHTVAYNAAAAPDRVGLIAGALGVAEEGAAVAALRDLGSSVGIPSAWSSVGLERGDIPILVDECLTRYPRPNNPRPLERRPLLALYEAAWEGGCAFG